MSVCIPDHGFLSGQCMHALEGAICESKDWTGPPLVLYFVIAIIKITSFIQGKRLSSQTGHLSCSEETERTAMPQKCHTIKECLIPQETEKKTLTE